MAKRKTFYVAAAIFENVHTAYAVAVYAYLSFCADKQGVCFPGMETIAKHCGITRNTVKKAMNELEQCGLLRTETTHQVSKNGRVRQCTNRYRLSLDLNRKDPPHEMTVSVSRDDPVPPHIMTPPPSRDAGEINNNSKITMGDVPSVGITGREATDRDGLDAIFEKIHLDCFFDQVFAQSVKQTIERMYESPHITVNGQKVERDAVRERLKLLTIDHIDFIEAQLDEHGGEVTHGERYLMSCIYNAPVDVLVNTSGAGSQLFR